MAVVLRYLFFPISFALSLLVSLSVHAATTNIDIGYLEFVQQKPPLLSNVLPEPEDKGLQGARLGLADNNNAGRFLGQKFNLHEAKDESIDVLLAQAQQWQQQGINLLIANMPAEQLRQLSLQLSNTDTLIFNAGAP